MVSFIVKASMVANATVKQYILKLTRGINDAMNTAYRRDPNSARNIFVANILLCKGVPFYGYHVGWKYFMKVYLLSPFYLNKLADLLITGKVLGLPMQPYESHIPYLLQFFTDFNLTGCGIMNISHALFRHPLPEDDPGISVDNVPPDLVLDPVEFPRLSHCELEIDIDASSIRDRLVLKERNLHNNFDETEELSDEIFIHTLAGIWTDEANRRHNEGMSSFQLPTESTQRVVGEPPWRRMKELQQGLKSRIDSDKFVFQDSFSRADNLVPTIFETVGAMFKDQPNIDYDKILQGILDEIEHPQAQTGEQPEVFEDSALLASFDTTVKSEVAPPKVEEPDLPPVEIKQEKEILSDFDSVDFNDTASSASDDHTAENLDPLSQEVLLHDVDFSDSESDPFGSFTDSIILNEINLQQSVLEVIRKDPSAERIILSQEGLKRSLSQGSFAKPSKSLATVSEYGLGSSSTDQLVSSSNPLTVSSENSDTERLFLKSITNSFSFTGTVYGAKIRPPTAVEVMNSFESLGLPRKEYKPPHFSNPKDVPPKPVVFAGLEFKLKSDGVQHLPAFSFDDFALSTLSQKLSLYPQSIESKQLQFARRPPSFREVAKWCKSKHDRRIVSHQSQIRGVTQKGKFNFKYATQKRLTSRKSEESKYLSVMTVEVHVNTREDYHPDPTQDQISAIFWTHQSEYNENWGDKDELFSGAIFVCRNEKERKRFKSACKFPATFTETELDAINSLVDVVRTHDPDILAGYEVSSSSWGYIIERGKRGYEIDLCDLFSRIRDVGFKLGDKITNNAISVTGRHVFNVWRILRNEVNLLKYSLENVVYHTIHHRLPFYSFKTLTNWFTGTSVSECALAIRYHFDRVFYTIDVINNLELISRTSEQARIVGIDFYSVFYRGSQYKVEAIMCRISKAENFLMTSPSRKQVGEQNALECIPLIMEPETKLYTSPVVVLDFQSLYPSIMIAYNYCYSTCLGRIHKWRDRYKLGFTNLDLPDGLLNHLKSGINIAPNGMIYVKQSVRRSLLAKMLVEILDTRVMVKDGMKSNKDNSSFQKLMNNRQLALKLIANVTYGYTSASYSGRMPCVEIADSIVQAARETLEKAIDTIRSNEKWGAEVVYGDTDSLFLHFPGKTKDQAFDLGQEIAQTVTGMNPEPVKLKFEKVYLPCILQTKKRYVGHMYEFKSQKEPIFDAKGMETVRRDGTPAQQKMEEKALDILFRTCDLSQVKAYLEEQWLKILTGNISVQDFCFSKEVKLGSYRGLLPPGAMVATEKIKHDIYAAPQYKERIPYVVLRGAPGDRLVDRCVSPEALINNSDVHLDSEYYITKNLIPPLERIFNLVGGNVRLWYDEMPRVVKFHQPLLQSKKKASAASGAGAPNLRHFLKDTSCRVCSNQCEDGSGGICGTCREHPFESLYTLSQRLRTREKTLNELIKICQNCAGISPAAPVECVSGDCPIYYSRKRAAVFYEDSCAHDTNAISQVSSW